MNSQKGGELNFQQTQAPEKRHTDQEIHIIPRKKSVFQRLGRRPQSPTPTTGKRHKTH
jgi:hypothetical protein